MILLCNLTLSTTATTVEMGRYTFQGVARPSLIFSGDILNAQATVTALDSIVNGEIKLSNTSGSSVNGTLAQFLINAANEKIDEINGVKYEEGKINESIDDRLYLTLALSAILSANDAVANKSEIQPLQLTFREVGIKTAFKSNPLSSE